MRKTILVLGIWLPSMLAVAVAVPATGSVPSGRDTIRNWQTGGCRDNDRSGKVYTDECNLGPNQKWTAASFNGNEELHHPLG
jgi:hypothetical protein